MTTPLSPAAQAVRNAYHEICEDYIETWLNFNHNRGLAAVLRAAADQLREAYANEEYVDAADDWLDDIAAELEGSNG